ncbi:alpha/beta-hydrolase family protein [Streptacidiphilus sp. P02-A3a]|uniref:alpha/beta hydrolase n=1 Tax=Streptacidiphilus sp. P02-A3a TaxID=2704468 RepID=UPI0015FA9CD2|nr:alpha/beta hydrolase [Streptacidiphilus sp. P02-A3a]QMU68639.1 hypothetical protein GXP74_10745 [Streptacidiphilus sp. P02-A3a]
MSSEPHGSTPWRDGRTPEGGGAPRGRRRRPAARLRVVRRAPSWGAVAGALLCYSVSLTPSLLPRAWWLQGLCAGVTAVIGYAAGALLGYLVGRLWRLWRDRPDDPRLRRTAWWLLAAVGLAGVVVVTAFSARWQEDVRRAVSLSAHVPWLGWTAVPLVALLVGGLLVLLARLLRLATGLIARLLSPYLPRAVGYGVGVVVLAFVTVGVVQGFLLSAALDVAENAASLADSGTRPGIVQPRLPTLSGSPASAESWDSLGFQGRNFVGEAPTRAELADFSGRPAMDPVRVYVGLRAADTLAGRAALAVSELERTGGFGRKVLAVMATTGSGWVNPQTTAPLEFMYGGDSALVAVQYSYLPSWVSVLTEDEAADAGRALFDAVYAKWSTLPPADRPKLVVFGESLGSYATEQAFHGSLAELSARTDGALLVGPTYDNPMWKRLTAERTPGSPAWRPVVGGGATVRFAQFPADLDLPAGPWDPPRTLYLQNGSDPIVWWSPGLAVHRPDWLDRPRAADVSSAMRWYPLITFWQVACDLVDANGVPDNHGHRYGTMPATGWAAVVPPPGWTVGDTARLERLMASRVQR